MTQGWSEEPWRQLQGGGGRESPMGFKDLDIRKSDYEKIADLLPGLASYLKLAANVSTTAAGISTTPIVFRIPVSPQTTYLIEFFVVVTTAATTVGYQFFLNGPASPTQLVYTFRGQAGTTTASDGVYHNNTYLQGYSSGFTASASGNNPFFGTVLLVNGPNGGNVDLIIRAQTSGSAVTAIKGSVARITKL